MAEFEKELLIERILAGQARARSEGAVFGRKPTFGTAEQRAAVLQRLADGISKRHGSAGLNAWQAGRPRIANEKLPL